jgi:hypothetical protein
MIVTEEIPVRPIERIMSWPMTPLFADGRNRRGTQCLAMVAATLVMTLAGVGCGKDSPRKEETQSREAGPSARRDLLIFPDELRVEDTAINDFVTRAMEVCAAGDYEAFRLLWSARDTPLPRAEFEQGWKAVETIRIRALERVMLAPDPDAGRSEAQTVYTAYAQVELDPSLRSQGVETRREVILMMVREQDEWRLARAPKAMRTWIRQRHAGANGDEAEKDGKGAPPVARPD